MVDVVPILFHSLYSACRELKPLPPLLTVLAGLGNFCLALGKGVGKPVFRVIQTHFAADNNIGAVAAKEEVSPSLRFVVRGSHHHFALRYRLFKGCTTARARASYSALMHACAPESVFNNHTHMLVKAGKPMHACMHAACRCGR